MSQRIFPGGGRKKVIGILQAIAVAAIVLVPAGCRKDKPVEERFPVAFRESSVRTKVDEGDYFQEGYSIGVYSYYLPEGNKSQKKEFMGNQTVSYTGGIWTYKPEKYWPSTPGDALSFYAYAPYMIPDTGNDPNEISFTIDGNTDFLWAESLSTNTDDTPSVHTPGAALTYAQGGGGICFNFKHLLQRLRFQFVRSTGFGGGHSVEKLTIKDQKSRIVIDSDAGTCTFDPDVTGDLVLTGGMKSYPIIDYGSVQPIDDAMYIPADAANLNLIIEVSGLEYNANVNLDNPAAGGSHLITIYFTNSYLTTSVKLEAWDDSYSGVDMGTIE